ncbi:hypothetical protein M0812_01028 [Anaeramoeba flamelloides]|uniref:Uncharacterized protein n=1 Tax=Anaeramoeba flamelloides TaxID=1746091 RepID=A0AAV8A716_9EUKA|nr:hypothetical protein M0812_01028 [Anaeramoeba flamelloides]|eukprot:Anaeramoba_flamelloidesa2706_92.p1 GENE.a2706_92~~a2706_92.p1  ORF type:complete len:196 (-),score=29.58 a2706_92:67-633(-)
MKNSNIFLLLFLIVAQFVFGCDNNKGCDDQDLPYCVSNKCVECSQTSHCDNNKYCTSKNVCEKYESDILGEFCNYFKDIPDKCESVASDNNICGKCEDNKLLWQGVCVHFECLACKNGDDNSGIAKNRPTLGCFPSGSSGYAGKIGSVQYNDNSPSSIPNDSMGIGLIVCGVFLFLVLILQCIMYFKS